MKKLKAAKKRFEGKLVTVDAGALERSRWNTESKSKGYRAYDRFMVTEVIALRDSDDDLMACVCASISGSGTCRAGFFYINDVAIE